MLSVSLSKKHPRVYDVSPKQSINPASNFFEENYNVDAVRVSKTRMYYAVAAFIGIYLLIAIRVMAVCLSHGVQIALPEDDFEQREIDVSVPINRADIVDRNGLAIATSLPTVNLYANPKKIKDPKDAAEKLVDLFEDMKYDDVYAKLTKKRSSFVMLRHDMSPAQQAEVNALGIPALEFQESEKRVYLHNNLFVHALGYTNIDNEGKAGIERFLNDRLIHSTTPLTVTLDTGVQDTIRTELAAAVEKFKAIGAAAILMDVNTGEVISMVSLPDYNPNVKIPVDDRALFNFTTQGIYEPGSVFKTFNTALGLESGKVKVKDKFDATKPIFVQRQRFQDFHGENRWLSVGEILIYSSNIGSIQLASRVGKEDQRKFLGNLGFFEKVKGLELYEKALPQFQSAKKWTDVTMATVSFGHGISVTPMHVITAFSALVNGGIYHEPTLIKTTERKLSRRVISEHTSEQMRPLLRDIVLYGTGRRADVAGYEVAGKTGTAEKVINGKYAKNRLTNTFLSAFPASNPKYALMVIIDEPKPTPETSGHSTSGWNAVPTTGKIIAEIAPQLGLQANFDLKTQRAHVKSVR
ncbi:MAG: penicillin-binding protein 2 [Alphaproteobacteria bacterium]|nr:penicillin-binding protein 2 [Alphaproteobacteria bacterium]